MGPTDSAAELFAIERPDRGANSAKADVPADPRLQPYVLRQPYVPRDLHADGRGDRGAELPHAGPHDCAAKLRTVEIVHFGALDAAVASGTLVDLKSLVQARAVCKSWRASVESKEVSDLRATMDTEPLIALVGGCDYYGANISTKISFRRDHGVRRIERASRRAQRRFGGAARVYSRK